MKRKYVLNQTRIDNIQSVDLDDLTFEDVYLHYHTGMGFSVMKNHEKISKYRNGVGTNIGDIEESVWKQIVKYLITKTARKKYMNTLSSTIKSMAIIEMKMNLKWML